MTRRWSPLLVAVALCSPAWATDHPQEALKLILKQNTVTGKAKAVWVSKLPAPVLPALPPTSVGGAFAVTGVDEQVSAPLPAADWQANPAGTLYKFVNKLAPGGGSPCKVALVKNVKVLKVVCKDSLIQLDDSAQGTAAVALTIGTDTYCSVCTTPLRDEPGKFVAKGCSAPLDCSAAVPTTTTTTSSTTSSTTTSTATTTSSTTSTEAPTTTSPPTTITTTTTTSTTTTTAVCGDHVCAQPVETFASCPADCVCPVCGDGACQSGEDCTACPTDCGVCPTVCGDSICDGAETCLTCSLDCPATAQPTLPLALGNCLFPGDCCDDSCLPTQAHDPNSDNSAWTGFLGEAASAAILEYFPAPCGDGNTVEIGVGDEISLNNGDLSPLYEAVRCLVCELDLREVLVPIIGCPNGYWNQAQPVTGFVTVYVNRLHDTSGGASVTWRGPDAADLCQQGGSVDGIEWRAMRRPDVCGQPGGECPSCGDGVCSGGAGETCSVCAADCGPCPPGCGDGTCSASENCTVCPADCGTCPPTCGDGFCMGWETGVPCPADCGPCAPGS